MGVFVYWQKERKNKYPRLATMACRKSAPVLTVGDIVNARTTTDGTKQYLVDEGHYFGRKWRDAAKIDSEPRFQEQLKAWRGRCKCPRCGKKRASLSTIN